jgi:hypothetical protein
LRFRRQRLRIVSRTFLTEYREGIMEKSRQALNFLLAKAISLYFKGYIHFPQDLKGTIIKESEDFIVFRKVILNHKNDSPDHPGAILKIFFRFKSYSFRINRILSLIPIPLIVAQQGFRSKTWMTGKETGTFHGLYEWDNIENAKQYLDSLPLNLMKKRAVPETLRYEIIDIRNEILEN